MRDGGRAGLAAALREAHVIDLKSPRWSELHHAYGAADDVPDMLEQLGGGNLEDVMGDLYSTICHQGTVYTASYAAVPHLAKIAGATQDPDQRAEILTLLGSIVAGADASQIPADLRDDYEACLPVATKLALKTLEEPIEPSAAIGAVSTTVPRSSRSNCCTRSNSRSPWAM